MSSGLGGTSGTHIAPGTHPILVSSATAAQHNTIRPGLFPVACWRIDDIRFQFGSSFPVHEAAEELVKLKDLIAQHPGAPLSIFGHADPVGTDDYNKALGGRRAAAIYALLTRKTDIWEELFSHASNHISAAPGDVWGEHSIQIMLARVGFDPGRRDGVVDEPTKAATRSFQRKRALPQSGVADVATRKLLYLDYMDALASPGLKLDPKKDFLGQGADPQGKADFQGCGEFNPILMFSDAENRAFEKSPDKTARDAENSLNRRVSVFLFRPGSVVDVQKWPCPRAREGATGCRKRFFSDSDTRRKFQALRRTNDGDRNTFACRFFDRLGGTSPCESAKPLATLVLRLQDTQEKPLKNLPYRLVVGDLEFVAKTNELGLLGHLVPKDSTKGQLFLDVGTFELTIRDLDGPDTLGGAASRLANLGFLGAAGAAGVPPERVELALRGFQFAHELEPTGKLTPETSSKLKALHGS